MYIGSLLILALVAIALVMFVKTCSIMRCPPKAGNETGMQGNAGAAGGEQ